MRSSLAWPASRSSFLGSGTRPLAVGARGKKRAPSIDSVQFERRKFSRARPSSNDPIRTRNERTRTTQQPARKGENEIFTRQPDRERLGPTSRVPGPFCGPPLIIITNAASGALNALFIRVNYRWRNQSSSGRCAIVSYTRDERRAARSAEITSARDLDGPVLTNGIV